MTTTTKKRPSKAKCMLITERTLEGAYGMSRRELIIEHTERGRLYLAEGWGADARGAECYRWKHGFCASLPKMAAFSWLDSLSKWEVCGQPSTRLEAFLEGCQVEGMAIQLWDGYAIESAALAALERGGQ